MQTGGGALKLRPLRHARLPARPAPPGDDDRQARCPVNCGFAEEIARTPSGRHLHHIAEFFVEQVVAAGCSYNALNCCGANLLTINPVGELNEGVF